MPIFENNGKKQNVQDAHVGKYMELYPDATTVMERDGKKYRVKAKDYNTFLGDTLEAPKMESAPQPAPQVEAEPQQKAYAQAARPTADAVPQLEADKSAYTFTAEELGIEESNGNAPAAPVELPYDGTKPVVPGMAKEGDIPGIDMEAYNANMAKAMAEGKVLSPGETQRRFEEREAEVAARLPQANAAMSQRMQQGQTVQGAFDRAYDNYRDNYPTIEADRLTKGLLDEYSAERAKRLSQVEKDVENYNSARKWAANPYTYGTDAYSEVAYRSNVTKLRNADELGMMEEFAKDAKKRLLADENLKAKAEENAELLGMPVERYINEVAVPIMQERMYSEWLAPQEERAKKNYNGLAAAAEGSLIGTLLGATRTDTEKYLSQVGQEAWRKNASLLGRAAAGAGSMLLDLPVFMGAGSLASVSAKAVGGQVFKQLAKNETKRLVARGVAEGAAQRYANYAVRNGLKNRILLNLSTAPLQSGLTFGMFDAGKAALNMSLNGEWDWKELGKSAVGGTLMGGALGATGAVGGGLTHGLTGATKAAAKVAEFGVENAVFTEGGRLIGKLHGQQPENGWLEDYVESGATLLMIKAPNIVKNVSAIKGDKEASEVFAFNRLEREQLGKYGEDLNAVLESLLPKSAKLYEDGLKINEGTFTEEYRRVMSDPEVSMTTKAKLMGIVEGKMMPAPKVVDAKIEGNRVMTYDPMGGLVEVKEYATEAKANAEYKKVANAAEIESIAVMEDMYMRIKGYEADDVTVREWLAKNPDVTAEDIANIIAKNSAGEKLTEGEQRILDSLRKARHEGLNDVRFLNDVLAELNDAGIDVKAVMSGIEKPIDERTEAENRAVKAYTDVLYQEIKAKVVEPFRRGEARRAEDIDTTVRLIESDRSVDETANDGMVYTTTTPSGEKIIITGGKVVLDNEGYIDVNQSEGLVAMFPDGQKKPVRPGDLREKVEVSNAEEVKAAKREEIKQEVAAEPIAESGEVAKNEVLTYEEGGETHSIEVLGDNGDGTSRIISDGQEKIIGNDLLESLRAQGVEAQKGENAEKVVESSPTGEAAAPVVEAPKTALEQIPRNENNIPLYEQVDSELAWDGVVEEAGGNEETAMVAVNSMIADKQDALKKAEKAKAKAGVTITEKIAAENERVANIEKAKADLAKWEEIAGVKAKRAAAQAENVAQPVAETAPVVESAPVVENSNVEGENGNVVETPQATNEMQEADLENAEKGEKAVEPGEENKPKVRGRKQVEKAVEKMRKADAEGNALEVLNNIQTAELNAKRGDEGAITPEELAEIDALKKKYADQGYEMQDMTGKVFDRGMRLEADFVIDESLPDGAEVIKSTIKPYIFKDGVMVQKAKVVVAQSPVEVEDGEVKPTVSQTGDNVAEGGNAPGQSGVAATLIKGAKWENTGEPDKIKSSRKKGDSHDITWYIGKKKYGSTTAERDLLVILAEDYGGDLNAVWNAYEQGEVLLSANEAAILKKLIETNTSVAELQQGTLKLDRENPAFERATKVTMDAVERLKANGVKVVKATKKMADALIKGSAEGLTADELHELRGVVARGLADAEVKIVRCGNNPFNTKQKTVDLKKEVLGYAEKNGIIGTMSNEETNGKGEIKISKKSINKFVDDSASDKSVDIDIHLSVLPQIREVIASSIETEVHPDYVKVGKDRSRENGYNKNVLMHRCYGAVNIDGKVYRVKITLKEDITNRYTKAYSYEVTNIELFEGADERAVTTFSQQDNSISAAKLLHNIEKSYDEGVKLLEASKNVPDFMTVFHGSGAKFDKFDHAFMGSGEGAQAFGWGTYVTEVEGIGRTYATTMRDKLISEKHKENAIINKLAKQTLESSNGNKEEALDYLRGLLNESWSDKKRVQAQIKIIETGKFLPETKQKANLYTVEIPDDNGSNYLHWDKPINRRVIDRIIKSLPKGIDVKFWVPNYLANASNTEKALWWMNEYYKRNSRSGEAFYNLLGATLGSDRAASEFLSDLGFVGISYPAEAVTGGRADKARNYVIFNENDTQIESRIEFLRTPDGVTYGWAVNGEIYLTPEGLNPNTPIHEYTHLWGADVEKNNPKLWNEVVEAMKLSPVWNEVANDANYSNIHGNDSRMASEVLARLSGRENYRRTMEDAEKEIAAERDIVGKVQKKGILNRIKNALKNFWDWVQRNVFTSGKRKDESGQRSSEVMPWEEFANSVIGDFYKGKNPDVKESSLERMAAGEAKKESAGKSAVKNNANFVSTYKTKDGKDIEYTSERAEGYGIQGGGTGNSYDGTGNSILQRQTDTGVPGANSGLNTEKGEFCVVERVFTENGAFNFTSGEKIESADDVAYIFSALEDAAKEHSFVVYVKDGKPTVIELGMGSFNTTMVDIPTASLAYSRINPDHVYFVHNHPSGNLVCSGEDVAMLRVFEDMSDVPVTGVIINLKTGKYGTFDTERHSAIGEKRVPENEERLTVHTLDKQIFAPDYDPMAQPLVRSSQDVAQFLNSQRMGDRPKVSFLILSRANRIIGNIHTPFTDITTDTEAVARYINERVIQFGGENAILYGDFAISMDESRGFRLLQGAMERFGKTKLLDVVHVEGNFTKSANDLGLLYEPETEYNVAKENGERYDSPEQDIPVEEVQTQPMTFAEKITNSVLEASAKNKENLALRSDALRMFGRDVANVLKLMGKQREYDKSTVDQLVKLAKMYFKDAQLLGGLTPYQVGRVMTRLNNAVGKRDITDDANELVNILVDAHNKELEKMLEKQAKTKAKKVNASGVEVIGKLDKEGQLLLEEYNAGKELDLESIDDKIIDLQNEAAEGKAEDAAARIRGLELARQYREEILKKRDEIKGLEQELKNAEKDVKDGVMTKDAYKEFRRATERAILESKLEMVDAYHGLIHGLGGDISSSAKRAKLFQQQQIDHVKEIQHNANSDLLGHPAEAQGETPDKWNSSVPRLFMSAMPTFQTMLKFFGEKAADGRGYLYERFIPQHTQASHNEYVGKTEAREKMREKLTEIFGKKTSIEDFMDMSRKDGAVLEYQEGGEKKTIDLTRGQVLYLYMINKMADGQMKLSRMGITDADVQKMANELPEEFLRFADWVQEEFLTELREKYNKVHERMFGAPMAAIESYFPIKINKRSRGEKIEPGMNAEDKPSTVTGSVIKRTKNAVAIDLSADAMQVLLGHIDDMENWAAWAEFRRGVKSLLNYRHFQNQVKGMESLRYGSGEKLWKNFVDVANIAAGSFKAKGSGFDKLAMNVTKGFVSSKIAFRYFTAVKQILSTPAFWSEVDFGKMMNAYLHQKEAWDWAMKNLPGFSKRWEGRASGNEILLESDADWKVWQNRAVQWLSKEGMRANAFIDALTVATGAKAVFETKYEMFKKAGYSEERAKEKALQRAAEAYNESQQSSESAYLSPLQAERTFLTALATAYRNSPFGYNRKMATAIANLKKKMKKGFKQESIEYMTKQLMRDGLNEEQAKEYAKSTYRRSVARDAADVALYEFFLNYIWVLGPSLIYILGGDDDEKKKELHNEALIDGAMGGLGNLPFGESVTSAVKAAVNDDWSLFKLPQSVAIGDIEKIADLANMDGYRAANEVLNALIAAGVGVNPQTFTDMFVALADTEEWSDPREIAMLVLRLINAPNSKLELLEADEAMENYGANIEEITREYAEYQKSKRAPLSGWLYSDESEQKAIERYEKRFKKILDERFESIVENTDEYDMWYENSDPQMKAKLAKLRQKFLEGDKETTMEKLDSIDITKKVLYGSGYDEVNTVYYELSTAEDEDMAMMIDTKLKELQPMMDEYKKLRGDERKAYREENLEQIQFYNRLNAHKNNVNNLKGAMKKKPEEAQEKMEKIRKIRTKAIDLINDYNE